MKNIEDIKSNLREYDYYFLKNIQQYINTELYFYGSVARFDYFPGKSDIDIIILTENVDSIVKQLQSHLNVNRNAIEKTINYMDDAKSMSYAHKINYTDLDNNLSLEIFVYDEKYREKLTSNIEKKNNLPFFVITVLYIIKFIRYNLRILSDEQFKYVKNTFINLYMRQTTEKHMVNLKV
jgi:predicted nucleotidyltransferase